MYFKTLMTINLNINQTFFGHYGHSGKQARSYIIKG